MCIFALNVFMSFIFISLNLIIKVLWMQIVFPNNLTWCISSQELLVNVLYSVIIDRTWQLTLTVMLWTRCHLFFSNFWTILVSSVLIIQALFNNNCKLSQAPCWEVREHSLWASSSILIGLDWRMHMHSQSVISFKSSIQRWTESTWIKCMLKRGKETDKYYFLFFFTHTSPSPIALNSSRPEYAGLTWYGQIHTKSYTSSGVLSNLSNKEISDVLLVTVHLPFSLSLF